MIEKLPCLEDPNSSLKSLHCFPKVKKIFVKFNTALTLSAPTERLFSFGSNILQGRRGNFTDENFERLTLLKANKCDADWQQNEFEKNFDKYINTFEKF